MPKSKKIISFSGKTYTNAKLVSNLALSFGTLDDILTNGALSTTPPGEIDSTGLVAGNVYGLRGSNRSTIIVCPRRFVDNVTAVIFNSTNGTCTGNMRISYLLSNGAQVFTNVTLNRPQFNKLTFNQVASEFIEPVDMTSLCRFVNATKISMRYDENNPFLKLKTFVFNKRIHESLVNDKLEFWSDFEQATQSVPEESYEDIAAAMSPSELKKLIKGLSKLSELMKV